MAEAPRPIFLDCEAAEPLSEGSAGFWTKNPGITEHLVTGPGGGD